MATNVLERCTEMHSQMPFLRHSSRDSAEDARTSTEAFSFSRVALEKIRRLRPKLKNEPLSVMFINNDDIVIVIEALYAALCQNVGADIPLDDIYGKIIRHIHKTRESVNWLPRQIGDAAFSVRVCHDKNNKKLQYNNAPMRIGAYHLFEASIEICDRATKKCLWYIPVERCGTDMRRQLGEFLIYAQKDKALIDDFVEFAHSLLRAARQDGCANRTIQYLNNYLCITMNISQRWSDIFMTDEVKKNLHDDFQFFLKNENWFRENRLQFKRGYLLTGLPGNGKTSAIRVMASTPGFRAFSFDFKHPQNSNNEDLYRAFERALQNTPAIFVLEDVDRIFDGEQSHTKVTKDAILNCLDGLGDRDGVVVVATANNPEVLDEAILKRPGRFDRIVKFESPNAAMRYEMLAKLFHANASNILDEDTLTWLVAESDGYSMASVKEIFVAAASLAFQDGSLTVSAEHAREAITAIRRQYARPAAKSIGLR